MGLKRWRGLAYQGKLGQALVFPGPRPRLRKPLPLREGRRPAHLPPGREAPLGLNAPRNGELTLRQTDRQLGSGQLLRAWCRRSRHLQCSSHLDSFSQIRLHLFLGASPGREDPSLLYLIKRCFSRWVGGEEQLAVITPADCSETPPDRRSRKRTPAHTRTHRDTR